MSTTDKKISIVTVNYNGCEDTCQMLESLRANVSYPYEVIVVDNGSRCDEAAVIAARFPGVVAVRSEENLGFAGGNNLGFKKATGDYILLLNNDTLVRDDSFRYLVEKLDSSPRIGAVCPKIRFAFAPEHIQFAGYTPLSRITLRNDLIGFDCPDDGRFDVPAATPYAHGAAMMVKREVLERVGDMPEMYFLYYEELDWSTRITEAGYEIWYEPRSTVFHKESASTGRTSPLKTYYLSRNRLLYAWRNRKGAEKYLGIAYQLAVAAPKNSLQCLLKGKPGLAGAVWRGCGAFFRLQSKTDRRS